MGDLVGDRRTDDRRREAKTLREAIFDRERRRRKVRVSLGFVDSVRCFMY